ncbi:MAG: DUF5592 family protein [Paraclostridium sp.]
MIFHIPKEISSENKLWKSIYVKDFAIITGTLFFAWITSSIVKTSLKIVYFIFMIIVSILLVQKNQNHNPNKRIYQSLILMMRRKRKTYHSLDFHK